MPVAHPNSICAGSSSNKAISAPLVKLGGSLTAPTVITKVCAGDVSLPLLAVPPLSCRRTVTVAEPLALVAGVNVRVPLAAIAGWAENKALLLLETMKLSACPASSTANGGGDAGYAKMAVAQ